jgi:hypothetical protein
MLELKRVKPKLGGKSFSITPHDMCPETPRPEEREAEGKWVLIPAEPEAPGPLDGLPPRGLVHGREPIPQSAASNSMISKI